MPDTTDLTNLIDLFRAARPCHCEEGADHIEGDLMLRFTSRDTIVTALRRDRVMSHPLCVIAYSTTDGVRFDLSLPGVGKHLTRYRTLDEAERALGLSESAP